MARRRFPQALNQLPIVYSVRKGIVIEWCPSPIDLEKVKSITLLRSEAIELQSKIKIKIKIEKAQTEKPKEDDYSGTIWVGADRFRYGGQVCYTDLQMLFDLLNLAINTHDQDYRMTESSKDAVDAALDAINRNLGLV